LLEWGLLTYWPSLVPWFGMVVYMIGFHDELLVKLRDSNCAPCRGSWLLPIGIQSSCFSNSGRLYEIACNCYWPLFGTIAVGAFVPGADAYTLNRN
jgi:hypothetical protein